MSHFSKLKLALADHSAALARLEELAAAEKTAQGQVEAASRSGDALSDAAIKKLTEANARLSIIPHHRTRTQTELKAADAGLRDAYRAASNHYAKHVATLIEAEYTKFCEALAPWYGSARQARRQTSEEFIPKLIDMRRTLYFSGGDTPTPEVLRDEARAFIRHVEKCAAETGYPIS